ncbi:bifunctional folylpolyglutamate synthase/dihydrofolate synthase [Horticoccus luteus]|uniref:tetrahydrofolate synthase n=1 Tax=Horticoccus luteus TaxID=2862869 RepID=A0A8F9XHD5_9BACT|nr:folylpolyglutamate synthase/dihydrofolate synthase family protein [Horticoccus luteus]QYM80152.1 bifunctional folylpolyglutamate synthase/dihydrofolate synthase [Horticoccus luteus]
MSSDHDSYAAVQDYLFSLKAAGVRFGIDRMAGLAAALGHPERQVPVVHVAGTNGKGSVAAMLEAIFRAAGWRTGLYTSPHLVRLGERVQVDRVPLSEGEIMAYTRELEPLAEVLGRAEADARPSFFEFMTAMAFLQFARRSCDIAVIEVGMGGRLDATNIVTPEVAVITSIGLDHCEQLGDTVEKIAAEKAGIIKPGRPVVIGRLPEGAERVVRAIAAERGAAVVSVREVYGDDTGNYPLTNLEGRYQRWNAATAALVARRMDVRWGLSDEIVARGLQQVTWPGRWQRTTLGGKQVVFDASHNPEGAVALEENLQSLFAGTGRKPVVVTGVLGAARARPLLETIARYAREIHLVRPQQERACSWEELEAFVPATFSGTVRRGTVPDIFPGPGQCRVGAADDVVVVTGSIYLLGEILARLEPARGANEGRLQDF